MEIDYASGGAGFIPGQMVFLANNAVIPAGVDLIPADGTLVPIEDVSEELRTALERANIPATNFTSRPPVGGFYSTTFPHALSFIAGRWVAPARYVSSYSRFFTATEDALDWTQGAIIGSNNNYVFSVKGNGKVYTFTMNSNGTAGDLYSTSDAINFPKISPNAAMTYPGGINYMIPNGMRYLKDRIFVFGRQSTGSHDLFNSTADEGATWQGGRGVLDATPIYDMAYAVIDGQDVFVAVGDNGGIEVSATGYNAFEAVISGVTEGLRCVIWNDALKLFVAFGLSGRVITSPDGRLWSKARSIDAISTPYKAIYVDELQTMVLVASSTALDNRKRILVGTDLESWRSEYVGTAADTAAVLEVAYANGRFAVAGSSFLFGLTEAAVAEPSTHVFMPKPKFDPGSDLRAYWVN